MAFWSVSGHIYLTTNCLDFSGKGTKFARKDVSKIELKFSGLSIFNL